jgi:hypothetical protein
MFWFLLHMAGAAIWFSWAVGWISYDPWVVTVAFILTSLRCVTDGIKSLVEE